MPHFIAFASSLVVTLILTPWVREWAGRHGFVDHPSHRKGHAHPTPLGGGLAMAAAVIAGLAGGGTAALVAGLSVSLADWRFSGAVLAGLLLSVAIGYRDDRVPLAPAWKLAGQGGVAAILVIGSGRPEAGALGGFAIPLVLVGVVAVMNACNFLDNMDGVLSGVTVVCAGALVAAALASGDDPMARVAVLAASAPAGAAAGFLASNFPPARVFMGDTGSLALGFLLGASALGVVPGHLPVRPALGCVLILGYPLFDLAFVTVTRMIDGRKVWIPGRDHTSHRLHRLLGNARRTALVIYAFAGLAALAGVVVYRWPGGASILVGLAGGLALMGAGIRLSRVPSGA